MSDAHGHPVAEATWEGGASPFAVGDKKLGMWLFIVSDALTFAALLVTYSYVRVVNDWPHPFAFSPAIIFSSMMTFVLLSSSMTMVLGVDAAARNDRVEAVRWVWLTALGGLIFIITHLYEWNHLIHEGVRPFANPYGTPLFGASFFLITGLHMTHVFIGVIYLSVIASRYGGGKYDAEDVEVAGLYWHFVDLVWMFVFPLIYLMSVKLH
jgi:cytochrome c oxidase subunit 3